MDFRFPEEVVKIFEVFADRGKELYLVGGSIRDLLLGLEPKDYDFATNASPEEVMSFFPRSVPTGIDYGTVTVLMDGESYEITTYRKDHDSDGRRPKSVSFSDSIREDLERRDFTINALAMDSQYQLLDYFQGVEDLKNGLIRFVGEPAERVAEDKLRLVRGIRFSAVYGFDIVEAEYNQVYKRTPPHDLSLISVERFQAELSKILLSSHPEKGLAMLEETGIIDAFIPEVRALVGFEQNTPHHDLDVWGHTLQVVAKTPPVLHIRLSALFHDIEKPSTYTEDEEGRGHFIGHEAASAARAVEIMKRLKFDTATTLKVEHLILHHMRKQLPKVGASQRRWIRSIGKENVFDLISLLKADASVLDQTDYDGFRDQLKELLESEPVIEREALAISGRDLMEAFGLEGRRIGEVLSYLLDAVIETPELNEKHQLICLAQRFLSDRQ